MEADIPSLDPIPAPRRFAFIDGLRGVAALAVVLFHFHDGPQKGALNAVLPRAVAFVFAHGNLGVDIFFVISGFVISRSARSERLTRGFAANFALRRQLRLDPPYWATLVIATANLYLPWILHPERASAPPPSGRSLLAHVFYLQNIVGMRDIVPVFWTLSIEVQFYTFFLGLVALQGRFEPSAQTRGADGGTSRVDAGSAAGVAAFLVSLVYVVAVGPDAHWFIAYWYMFALGDAAARYAEGKLGTSQLSATLAAAIVAGVLARSTAAFVAVATCAAIALASRTGGLHRWLRGRVVQFLGTISYSLYLVHYDVGFRVLNAGYKLTGDATRPAFAWFLIAITLSILAAYVFHLLVEKPSVRLAARFRPRRPPPPALELEGQASNSANAA